jgi:hypothetical protein
MLTSTCCLYTFAPDNTIKNMKTLIVLALALAGCGVACAVWYNLHLRIDIVPLGICFVGGWLAGWAGRWLWVDIAKREKPDKATPPRT